MKFMQLCRIATLALIVASFISLLPADTRQLEIPGSMTQTRLLENSDYGFGASFQVGRLSLSELNTRNGIFDELSIESYGFTTDVGEPKLPMQRLFISVPLGAKVKLEVLEQSSHRFDGSQSRLLHRIIPAQEPVSKADDPATIPFALKEEAYKSPGYRSRQLFRIEELGMMRGVRLFALEYYPVAYDPASGSISVTDHASVRVSFENPDLAASADLLARTASFEYQRLYANTIFNWDAGSSRSIERYPTKYLILCPPAYTSTMQTFIDWKKQQGYQVILTTVGTGGNVANTTSAVQSYMQNLWNSATAQDPAPSYLLIVGDHGTTGDNITANTGATSSGHITDLTYVRLNGTDYLPEMYYGRFSVSSTTELSNIINKTITFEKTQMADLSYLGKTVLIAGVDASYASTHGNGAINYATSQYFTSANGITSNNYLYPASGSSASAILANANEGRGFMNYTAHGSETSWADPSFTVANVNSMTNTGKYGVMVGNCCITNKFNYSSPCFGEAIIRKANAGGVAYIGGTNNTYWDEDYYWAVGYKTPISATAPAYNASRLGAYDAMFHTHGEAQSNWAQTIGDQIYMGNLAVSQSGSSRTNYYWEIYSIMGDPSLMPYMGVPSTNNASFPSSIPLGITSITVTAAPYSRVALSKDGTLYASQIVPASGSLNLSFPAFTSLGTASLVITAQNKITRIQNISIISSSTPYMTVTAVNYADSNNNQPEYGDNGRFNVTFKNAGGAAASNITATLTCLTPGITITDNTESISSLGAGATITRTNAYSFTIANNVANGTQAAFTISMTAGGETWTHEFTLELRSPALSFGAITVSDLSGNNNSSLDPGENVTLSIILSNNGLAASPAGSVSLSCPVAGISISPSSTNVPAINAGASTSVSFNVSAAASVAMGTSAAFTFNGSFGAYTASEVRNLEIGAPQELILGTDSYTQRYPMDRYYNYSSHESLYLGSEIGAPASIKSIAFYKMSGSDTNPIENVQIYMKNTTESSFTSGAYSLTGYSLVYSGSFQNDATSGWMEVDLNTRFNYNGSNLAILILKGNQAYINSTVSPNWTYTDYSPYRARQASSDSAQPTNLTQTGSRPNLRLKLFPQAGYLAPPHSLEAVAGNGLVNLSWQTPVLGTPTGYKIYRNNTLHANLNGLSYTDTAVTNGVSYSYYIKAVYPSGDSEASNTVTATPSIITSVILGNGTTSTSNTEGSPINIYYKSLHGQSVYTKTELNAMSVFGPINISHIGFNITNLPDRAMPNYLIRMGHTSATNSTNWISTGLSPVWTSASFQPTELGWQMFELSTPFLWNGTDNIVVDTAFGLVSSYSSTGTVQCTNLTTGYRFSRSDSSDQTNVFSSGSSSNNRPNLKMTLMPNIDGAMIQVNPTALDYGSVPVGTSSTLQFSIQNYGTQALSGSIITPAGFNVIQAPTRDQQEPLQRNTLAFSINAGATKSYNLSFSPSAATSYNGNLTINSNAQNNATLQIPITASAYNPPAISLSTTSLSQTLLLSEEANQTLTILNTGSQALNYSIVVEETRSSSRNPQLQSASQDRNITGSTLTLNADSYMPGSTVNWSFTVTNGSTDVEWLKGVSISFPSGVIVNSASSFVGGSGGNLNPDITSGNGVTINWFGQSSGGWGVIQDSESATATLSVTIASFSGTMQLPFTITGDIYGSEPHNLGGTITLTQESTPVEWLSVSPMGGTVAAGASANLVCHFSAIGITPANYQAQIKINSNDPLHPQSVVNVNLQVIEYINRPPVFNPPDHLEFYKNSSLQVNFAPYCSDPDGDPLSLSCIGNSQIQVSFNGLSASFSAPQNWTGDEVITFVLSDGSLQTQGEIYVQVMPTAMPSWTPQIYPNIPATLLGTVRINGAPAALNDWVGAFAGNECRGMAEVYMDGANSRVSLPIQLAAEGETIRFRLYRYADNAVYPIQAVVNPGFGALLGSPQSVILNAITNPSLATPVISSIQSTPLGFELVWNPVNYATHYQVWRSDSPNGTYSVIGTTSQASFLDDTSQTRAFYRVKAIMELDAK